MSTPLSASDTLIADHRQPEIVALGNHRPPAESADSSLPRTITKAASLHSFYTIRLLVDRRRVRDAYLAYAYFRWVDDTLDNGALAESERIAFIERQQRLVATCYRGEPVHHVCAEEQMLVDLVAHDPNPTSGLALYVQNLLRVMVFDAHRRGRVILEMELVEYSYRLAAAVTEALHYFIGHDAASPQDETRYLAVVGAHITHMLRDTYDDVEAGYFNISSEFLNQHGITPYDVTSEPYQAWVKSRVTLARDCFAAGRRYLSQVKCRRCRMAGYAYMARFEHVLDCIEADGYRLRPAYPELKHRTLMWNALKRAF